MYAVRHPVPEAMVVRASEHVVSSRQPKKGKEPGQNATEIFVVR